MKDVTVEQISTLNGESQSFVDTDNSNECKIAQVILSKHGALNCSDSDRLVFDNDKIFWLRQGQPRVVFSSTTIKMMNFCPELQLILIRPKNDLLKQLISSNDFVRITFIFIFIEMKRGQKPVEPGKLLGLHASLDGKPNGKDLFLSKFASRKLLENNGIALEDVMSDNSRKRSISNNTSSSGLFNTVNSISAKCMRLLSGSSSSIVQNKKTPVKEKSDGNADDSDDLIIIGDDGVEESVQVSGTEEAHFNVIPSPISLNPMVNTQPVFEDKPFILDSYNITLTDEEVLCLEPLTFINDKLINFYLRFLVAERLSQSQQNQTHIFNCFFYTRLAQILQEPLPHSSINSHSVNSKVNAANAGTSLRIIPILGGIIPLEVTIIPADSSIPVTSLAQGASISVQQSLPQKLAPAQPKLYSIPENMAQMQSMHSRLDKWTRKLSLFEKDFVIIPINECSHWYLAMVCFPWMAGMVRYMTNSKDSDRENYCQINPEYADLVTNCQESDPEKVIGACEGIKRLPGQKPKEAFEAWRRRRYSCFRACGIDALPCVLIFDSLPSIRRTVALQTVRNFLKLEWAVRNSKLDGELSFDRETVRGFSPRVPAQSNLADCGIYLLHYVEMFFKNPLTSYTKDFFQHNMTQWFQKDHIDKKRKDIRDILLELYEKQNIK